MVHTRVSVVGVPVYACTVSVVGVPVYACTVSAAEHKHAEQSNKLTGRQNINSLQLNTHAKPNQEVSTRDEWKERGIPCLALLLSVDHQLMPHLFSSSTGEEAPAAAARPALGGDENCTVQIVGDELLASRVDVARAIKEKNVNTVVLDIGKRPTITDNVIMCNNAQKGGCGVIVGARPGETEDTFLSDLAVGLCAGQLKAGAPNHGEHTAKYNQLLRIASRPAAPPFAGGQFRSMGMKRRQSQTASDVEAPPPGR
jgi:hypothetical protein